MGALTSLQGSCVATCRVLGASSMGTVCHCWRLAMAAVASRCVCMQQAGSSGSHVSSEARQDCQASTASSQWAVASCCRTPGRRQERPTLSSLAPACSLPDLAKAQRCCHHTAPSTRTPGAAQQRWRLLACSRPSGMPGQSQTLSRPTASCPKGRCDSMRSLRHPPRQPNHTSSTENRMIARLVVGPHRDRPRILRASLHGFACGVYVCE